MNSSILLVAALLTVSACGSRDSAYESKSADNPNAGGCAGLVAAGVDGQAVCSFVDSLGDPTDDQLFDINVKTATSWFSSSTPTNGVRAIQECAGINAFALPDTREIYFGKNLTARLHASGSTDSGMRIVLGHEFGHHVQFQNGWYDSASVPTSHKELEADFFGGLYVGMTSGGSAADFPNVFNVLQSLGEEDFGNPSHHGTAIERRAMGQWGFELGQQLLQAGNSSSWEVIHAAAQSRLSSMSPGG